MKADFGTVALVRRVGSPFWYGSLVIGNKLLQVPKQPQQMVCLEVPICAGCLSAEKLEGFPWEAKESRGSCACVKGAVAAAKLEGGKRFALVASGAAQVAANGRSRERLKWGPVFEAYARCDLKDRMDRLGSLRQIIEGPTGGKAEEMFVDALTHDQVDAWAWMKQQYALRGWTVRGTAPADAWEQLRVLAKSVGAEGMGLDYKARRTVNTTIRVMLNDAKSVVGELSRSKYLKAFRGKLDCLDWLAKVRLPLPSPDNKGGIPAEAHARMWAALPGLRAARPRLWLAIQVLWFTGIRPIELKAIRTDWLEEDAAGNVFLTVRNRPALPENYRPEDAGMGWLRSEFNVKAWENGQERAIGLPAEVVAVVDEIGMLGWSIFGLRNLTQAQTLHRDVNAWVREFVPSGKHAAYLFRQESLTVRARADGLEAARVAAGHANAEMTSHYVTPQVESRALTFADLAPRANGGRKIRARPEDGC